MVFVTGDYASEGIIRNRLHDYLNSFRAAPEFHLLCRTDEDAATAQTALQHGDYGAARITVQRHQGSLSTQLNNILGGSTAAFAVVDRLTLSYSIVGLLSPLLRAAAPAFTFANLGVHKINEDAHTPLELIDLLTISAIPENMAFATATWKQTPGFDTQLDEKTAIWDLSIELLSRPGHFALEVEAGVQGNFENLSTNGIPDHDYKRIIEKHKRLFEENLSHVLKVVSEHQQIPHHEILKLNYKLTTLQSLLLFSKDELRSLHEQRNNLQKQLSLLENKWYYKVSRKINHYKKIFFKEKSGGGKGILKMLKFFLFAFTKPGFRIARRIIKGGLKRMYILAETRPVKIIYLDGETGTAPEQLDNYNEWVHKKLDIAVLRKEYNETISSLNIRPKISIIMPVYNPPTDFLKRAIESVKAQLYSNWELCIADDASPNPQIRRLINSFTASDGRVKSVFRSENGHISANSNSALQLATGDYVLCLDHDDELTVNCLFEIVKHLNEFPKDEIIYSDEDKVDVNGHHTEPYFKPDWAPDNLLAKNYITHIAVFKKSLMDALGGYRLGFEGSQDYDLVLRATEMTSHIGHIPKILYHWRLHAASASQTEEIKPYAFIAAKRALEEAMQRRKLPAEVHYLSGLKGYGINYKITAPGKVSIIIPTKDQARLMQVTIDSIVKLTDYTDYEIIVLNNNSVTPEFFDLMVHYEKELGGRFKCLEAKFPFNFAKLMNIGVAASKGDYILLLNNDVEIIHADWLTKMVSYAQQERIGAVGVKLLYPDDNIQHAGTVVGLGGVAGHVMVNYYKNDPGYFNYLQSTTNYSAVTAACLMIRRKVYEEVGGMDELLEVEFNDVDFCLQILEHGYYNIYVPEVVLYHYESATRGHPHQTKASYERHIREIDYFKKKWDRYIKRDPFYNPNLSLDFQDFRTNMNA